MAENLSATIAGLRSWARGAYAEEAAVELLARSFCGRFASTSWPWVRPCDGGGWYWLDADAIWTGTGALSGGERRMLNVVAALIGGQPLADLGGVLAGLDRQNLALILAAFAHAGGSHEHSVLITTAGGDLAFERPGPVVDWPGPGRGGGIMFSAVAVAILLALVIAFLIKVKVLRVWGALVCIVFGLVLGVTPIGDPVQHALNVSGTWLWGQVSRL